jgi:DNA-binding response OmpR family regulator
MSDTQTLLVAIANGDQRDHVAGQFDADGHTVYTADCAAATIAKLATVAADALVLGPLQHAAAAPALLRELRAGTLNARVHPAQPVITLGDTDDLTTLRAYDAGSDHHLALDVHYLVVRAVLAAVARRTNSELTSRHVQIGDLHIDCSARTADIDGTPVYLSRTEFELLCQLASDPQRVFTKQQLMRAVWGRDSDGRTRTLDSHACRLRHRLKAAGGHGLVIARWGVGYHLAPLG